MTLREHQVAAIRDLYFRWQDRMAAITHAYNDKDPSIRDALSAVGELWDLPCRSGKTRAALTVLYHWQDWLKNWGIPALLLDDWLIRPNLVLAPSSMVRDGAWVEDWAHVCPDWDQRSEVFGQFQYTIDTFPGGLWPIGTLTPSKMRFVVKSLKPNDILVITYDTLRERADIISSRPYGLLVADEVHMLKNPRAQWTQAAYKLQSVARLGLSATPFTNYVHELIHVLRFLQGWTTPWGERVSSIWPSPWRWEQAHCAFKWERPKRGLAWRKVRAGAYNPEHMYHWLRSEVLFSLASAEVSDAPEPNIRPIRVELSWRQQDAYDQLAKGMLRWTDAYDKTDTFDTGTALAQMTYLFQLTADARQLKIAMQKKRAGSMLDYTDLTPGFLDGWTLDDVNSKLKVLLWLLEHTDGDQILVLTGFKHVASLISGDLGRMGYKADYITGDVKDRQLALDKFAAGETQIMLCTRAAWQGISLAAPHVVLFGFVDHVPGMVRQAIRRAWTMDDTRAVTNRLAAKDQYATVLTGGAEPPVFKPVTLEEALRGG